MFAIVFGIVYAATMGAMWIMSISLNGEVKIEMLYICLLLFAPFLIMFLVGNRQVIFSRQDERIYRSYGVGRKELARFSEIRNIELAGGSPSYRMYLKSDPYGKGINLLTPATPKAIQEFDQNLMPALQKMLHISDAEVVQLPVDLANLKYYTRKGNTFTLLRHFEIGWNIFLLCLAILFLYLGVTTKNAVLIYCIIPMTLIAMGLLTHTRKFDTATKVFTHSIAFFYKKAYRFDQFIRFLAVRTSVNGMYSGTDIKLVFQNDKGKEETVKLLNMRKTKKIEQFMQETKEIMSAVQSQ